MKPAILFFLLTVSFIQLFGQRLEDSANFKKEKLFRNQIYLKPQSPSTEICNNGIDDDGNGLADIKDFSCFFNSIPSDTCYQTKILWGLYNYKLYWVDIETNNYRFINFSTNAIYFDIAWTPDGKLYGIDGFSNEIVEIDPYTGQTQVRYLVTGYIGSNGMVSDASGNLYLTSKAGSSWYVTKLNLSTGQLTIIADLSTHGVASSGDLAFVNGSLYVSCENNKIAKVDVFTGTVQAFDVTGPYAIGQGLTTFGDGYLYVGGTNYINRVDPATMTSTLYYNLPTNGGISGLTSYSEFCNAPGCRSKLDNISIESSVPYCSNTGVKLKGSGRGITPAPQYTWALPDGSTRNGDTITVFTSGTYSLRYHSTPDTCGSEKSITIGIKQFPAATLGKDTTLCVGAGPILLQPKDTADVTGYLWQNGSQAKNFSAIQPGIYWVKTSNACGSNIDSIEVFAGAPPRINIIGEQLICPASTLQLANQFPRNSDEHYLWATNETADNITISQPGTYWLEGTNTCGKSTDTIQVVAKDSCICNPLFPKVDLGDDIELCDNNKKVITNKLNSSAFTNTWQDGTHANSYTITQPGTYWLNVSTYCGDVRDSITVTRKTEGCVCSVYFPTAFTPDVNGKNDFFKPLSECSIAGTIQIYNRWGELVYESSELLKGWDGMYKGRLQPSGVYVYNVRYKYLSRAGEYDRRGSFVMLK